MKRKPPTTRELIRQSLDENRELRCSVDALTTRLDNMPRPTLIASELQSIRETVEATGLLLTNLNRKARK